MTTTSDFLNLIDLGILFNFALLNLDLNNHTLQKFQFDTNALTPIYTDTIFDTNL